MPPARLCFGFFKSFRKAISFSLILSFIVTNQALPAPTASSEKSTPANFQSLDFLPIPSQLGRLQETYRGNSNQTVILIQDAHAIPEAQQNIQKLIAHFQKNYGVQTVALEGAASKLDPQIFRSFPDKKRLKEVLNKYSETGELTGTTAAAILNETEAAYHGVEDWEQYEEGVRLYLEAIKHETELLTEFSQRWENLRKRKKAIYSKPLRELDQTLEAFEKKQISLDDVLKHLFKLREKRLQAGDALSVPSSIQILFHEIQREEKGDSGIEKEVKALARKIKAQGKTDAEFNHQYQRFFTSKISAVEFATYLEEMHFSDKPFSFSNRLSRLIKNHRHAAEIQGPEFFKAFETYVGSLKESLFRNLEERALDQESRHLYLLEKLAKLELTREEWEELKARYGEGEKERKNYKAHFAFYHNAELRDKIFFKNLNRLFSRSPLHPFSPSAILITGGFHTPGLTERLREHEISYYLVNPQIRDIPEKTNYREHMRGEVSWKSYYREENGTVNLHDAFVRAVRDQLIANSVEPLIPERYTLKTWRDQIIRDLAEQKEIEKASNYTKYLDEIVADKNAFHPVWMRKLERFIADLRQLEATNQLNEQNIRQLFKPSTLADAATYAVLSPSARSEVRQQHHSIGAESSQLENLTEEQVQTAHQELLINWLKLIEDRENGTRKAHLAKFLHEDLETRSDQIGRAVEPARRFILNHLFNRSEMRTKRVATTSILRSEVRPPLKILLADEPGKLQLPEGIKIVGERGIGKENPERLKTIIQKEKPDVLFVRSGTQVNRDVLEVYAKSLNPKTPIVLRGGADTDNVDLASARQLGVIVVRTHGNQDSVAELFFAFFYGALRLLYPQNFESGMPNPKDFSWSSLVSLYPNEFISAIAKSEKAGRGNMLDAHRDFLFAQHARGKQDDIKTLLKDFKVALIGFGAIPQQIAPRLRALGASVMVVLSERGTNRNEAEASGTEIADKQKILEEADVISLHIPGKAGVYLGETEFKILSKRERPVVVINTARQAGVDHEALLAVLRQRNDTGQPLPLYYLADIDLAKNNVPIEILDTLRKEFPKNVFLTNHIGASTPTAEAGVEAKTLSSFQEISEVSSGLKSWNEAKLDFVVLPRSEARQLTKEQIEHLDRVVEAYKLSKADRMYLMGMWHQYLHPDPNKKPLRIGSNTEAGENFILSSVLSADERQKLLGAIDYHTLVENENLEAAKNVIVTANSMDGGIGESLARGLWLAKRAEQETGIKTRVELGAKGTDLGYDLMIDGKSVFVSIAEAKILQLIQKAQSNKFAGIRFQPLVNEQSIQSYENLLNSPYLYDRLREVAQPRTVKQVMEENEIEILEMLEQADLPRISLKDGNITLNKKVKRQPGGHGQWGVLFLYESYKTDLPEDGRTRIRAFYNGDNLNSGVNEYIAGFMAKNKIPILKLTTAATPIDKKGGKDGVRIMSLNGKTVYVPDQLEIADAKRAGQEKIFYEAGQEGGLGETGKQAFNTNVIYINDTVLHPILRDLAEALGGEEHLASIFSPSLIDQSAKAIEWKGERFIPLDGAMGSAIHNLNAYFMLNQNDPRIKTIIEKHGLKDGRLLYFIDVPRTDFFTPVKVASDMWLQNYSDYYKFNVQTMRLEDSREGLTPPEFDLKSLGPDGKDDKYWLELQNLVDSLGQARAVDLKSLDITGKALLKNARLIGDVKIVNETGEAVDLRAPEFREKLQSLFEGDQLILHNVSITFKVDREIDITRSELRASQSREARRFTVSLMKPPSVNIAYLILQQLSREKSPLNQWWRLHRERPKRSEVRSRRSPADKQILLIQELAKRSWYTVQILNPQRLMEYSNRQDHYIPDLKRNEILERFVLLTSPDAVIEAPRLMFDSQFPSISGIDIEPGENRKEVFVKSVDRGPYEMNRFSKAWVDELGNIFLIDHQDNNTLVVINSADPVIRGFSESNLSHTGLTLLWDDSTGFFSRSEVRHQWIEDLSSILDNAVSFLNYYNEAEALTHPDLGEKQIQNYIQRLEEIEGTFMPVEFDLPAIQIFTSAKKLFEDQLEKQRAEMEFKEILSEQIELGRKKIKIYEEAGQMQHARASEEWLSHYEEAMHPNPFQDKFGELLSNLKGLKEKLTVLRSEARSVQAVYDVILEKIREQLPDFPEERMGEFQPHIDSLFSEVEKILSAGDYFSIQIHTVPGQYTHMSSWDSGTPHVPNDFTIEGLSLLRFSRSETRGRATLKLPDAPQQAARLNFKEGLVLIKKVLKPGLTGNLRVEADENNSTGAYLRVLHADNQISFFSENQWELLTTHRDSFFNVNSEGVIILVLVRPPQLNSQAVNQIPWKTADELLKPTRSEVREKISLARIESDIIDWLRAIHSFGGPFSEAIRTESQNQLNLTAENNSKLLESVFLGLTGKDWGKYKIYLPNGHKNQLKDWKDAFITTLIKALQDAKVELSEAVEDEIRKRAQPSESAIPQFSSVPPEAHEPNFALERLRIELPPARLADASRSEVRIAAGNTIDVLRGIDELAENTVKILIRVGSQIEPYLYAAAAEAAIVEQGEETVVSKAQFKAMTQIHKPTVIVYQIRESDLQKMKGREEAILRELLKAAYNTGASNSNVLSRIQFPESLHNTVNAQTALLNARQQEGVRWSIEDQQITIYNSRLPNVMALITKEADVTVTSEPESARGKIFAADRYHNRSEIRYEGPEGSKIPARIFTAALLLAAESLKEQLLKGLVQYKTNRFRAQSEDALESFRHLEGLLQEARLKLLTAIAA